MGSSSVPPPRPSERIRHLVDAVLNLYTGARADVERTISAHYAADATFEDPLVQVRGRGAVLDNFVAVKAMFVSATVCDVEVSASELPEDVAASQLVAIRFLVLYRPSQLLGDLALPVRQTTRLRLGTGGLVKAHVDEWHNPLGLLMKLPVPLCHIWDTWRSFVGGTTAALTHQATALLDAAVAPALRVSTRLDKALARAAATELSAAGALGTLCDLRGLVGASAIHDTRNTTVVLVGELGDVFRGIASSLARSGASSLHLVSAAGPALSEQAGLLRAEARRCQVTQHGVDLRRADEVTLSCWAIRQLLAGQGQRVDVLVVGPLTLFAAAPGPGGSEEGSAAGEAAEGEEEAEVLQALLAGLQPALSARARVVITASAAAWWLPQPASDGGDEGRIAATRLHVLRVRARQQAERVAMARSQGLKWAGEAEGLVCVSCTPGGWWSACAELVAAASGIGPVRLAAQLAGWVPGSRHAVSAIRAVAAAQAASSVLQLCNRDVYVSPGAYYWGQHRASGLVGGQGIPIRGEAFEGGEGSGAGQGES